MLTRRFFLSGLIAAPAVIAADRLMPVKLWKPPRIPNSLIIGEGHNLYLRPGLHYPGDIQRALDYMHTFGVKELWLDPRSATAPPGATTGG